MQTAVEWLIKQMDIRMDIRIENTTIGEELLEQTKEMGKQQIIDAFNQGYREGWIDSISGDCTNDQDVETFEDANLYYTSTYGSKGSDECQFEVTTNTSSATICKHCGREKFLHKQ